jgi:ribosomal protein L18E
MGKIIFLKEYSVSDSLKIWKKIAKKVEVLSWFRQI